MGIIIEYMEGSKYGTGKEGEGGGILFNQN